jgi:tetratricopeptide (TPR) repeat protein
MIVSHEPKNYRAIMVSSTFTDLEAHRQKVIEAIQKFGPKANVMEHDGARARVNVIESSLNMVRDSAAYVGVISRKYGQAPLDPKLNPGGLSLTEIEFNEAMRLGRPILLFIMGEKHPVTEADIELDPAKREKLEAFRERAKRMDEDSEVERLYETFDNLEQFSTASAVGIGRLVQHLDLTQDQGGTAEVENSTSGGDALPRPPELAALPRYLGSHKFVGRASELQTLTNWCGAADPNPMLLFEAMGGSGKSMLTWEWLTKRAKDARGDWAGRFWFSFYEKGAVMAGFCRHALAYMTTKPVEEFVKLRTPELSDRLVAELEKRPWLLVLDGLERILVAYHRHDAAQLPDDEADTTGDQIGKRDPCAAIRPEDDELLRRLAAVAPSKILISSRLTPSALINRSGVRVPGVRREILPGLRPVDAEAMIRLCGVTGEVQTIQAYLQTNCDCHPLVVGALAGLINNYPPDRGNFDQWVSDTRHGGALNLAKLDLVQRRNHILLTAIDVLEPASRQLLHTLALLQGGGDFETLTAFNPHLPLQPEKLEAPINPKDFPFWSRKNKDERAAAKVHYEAELARWQAYVEALAKWECDPDVRAAPAKLWGIIRDLEKRGLLQYGPDGRRYDLHPVVRGVAAGRMATDETQELGQKVVDYFNNQPHDLWESAEVLEDVAPGLQIVRVLCRMQRYDQAMDAYRGSLSHALMFNLDSRTEVQALMRPFFPHGWYGAAVSVNDLNLSHLLNDTALSLLRASPDVAWSLLEKVVSLGIQKPNSNAVHGGLTNLVKISLNANKLAEAVRLGSLSQQLADAMEQTDIIFQSKARLYSILIEYGDSKTTDHLWQEFDGMGRNWQRALYRPCDAEFDRALDLFYRGELTEKILAQAETLARDGHNRPVIQRLYTLRGEWHLARQEPSRAVDNLALAVRMAREVAYDSVRSEALLALARFRAGEQFDVHEVVEKLIKIPDDATLPIAELWSSLGESELAITYALRAHRWALADGEPYVHRYSLNRIQALLTDLGEVLPSVPRYDSKNAARYPWEDDVRAYIIELQAKKGRKRPKVGSATKPARGTRKQKK